MLNCMKVFAAAAVVACIGRADAAATLTANNWQKDGANVLGGSLTNEAHWSRGHVPQTG